MAPSKTFVVLALVVIATVAFGHGAELTLKGEGDGQLRKLHLSDHVLEDETAQLDVQLEKGDLTET